MPRGSTHLVVALSVTTVCYFSVRGPSKSLPPLKQPAVSNAHSDGESSGSVPRPLTSQLDPKAVWESILAEPSPSRQSASGQSTGLVHYGKDEGASAQAATQWSPPRNTGDPSASSTGETVESLGKLRHSASEHGSGVPGGQSPKGKIDPETGMVYYSADTPHRKPTVGDAGTLLETKGATGEGIPAAPRPLVPVPPKSMAEPATRQPLPPNPRAVNPKDPKENTHDRQLSRKPATPANQAQGPKSTAGLPPDATVDRILREWYGLQTTKLQATLLQDAQSRRSNDFARFEALRRENRLLYKQSAELDYLDGLPQRDTVEKVCGHVEDLAARTMCHRRGRRMAERFNSYYNATTVKRTLQDADQQMVYTSKDGVRISVVNGEIFRHAVHGSDEERGFYSVQRDEAIAVSWVSAALRSVPESVKKSFVCDVFIQFGDGCQNFTAVQQHNSPYPAVTFSTSTAYCPQNTPIFWNSIMQDALFVPTEQPRSFEKLKPRMVFRGTGWNLPRYYVSLLGVSKALPFVDSGIAGEEHLSRCPPRITRLSERKTLLSGTKWVDPKVCTSEAGGVFLQPLAYDDIIAFKYLYLPDGMAGLFRLAPNLRAPGIVLTQSFLNYEMSFTEDLYPYVHYIPLTPNLADVGSEILNLYLWLETNSAIAADIARESTHWSRKHATNKQFHLDWILYMALVSEMQASTAEDYRRQYEPKPLNCGGQLFNSSLEAVELAYGLRALACGPS
ncbi:hypothetical protein DIPPA_18259 [Diplonema papillatum]|nr:hypothetical protein DIPPA_18259 [Diplonema papillatum]